MRAFVYRSVLLVLWPLLAQADAVLESQLLRYQGRWVGHLTIHSSSTGYRETFAVEQRYWWEDGQLRCVAVSQRPQGSSRARSCYRVQGDKIFSEVTYDSGVEHYWGMLHEDSIVWLSADLRRAKDYQMKETLSEAEGQAVLKVEGFDTYLTGAGLAQLVYQGELERVE